MTSKLKDLLSKVENTIESEPLIPKIPKTGSGEVKAMVAWIVVFMMAVN